MKKLVLAAILCLLVPINAMAILVQFDSTNYDVLLGETFTVNILANIDEPVIGWGLDLAFDGTILSLTTSPVIGSAWSAAGSIDGDGLAGIYFQPLLPTLPPSLPPPLPTIMGDNILLATLSFEAIGITTNESILSLSYTDPLQDATEGFPKLPIGQFVDATNVSFEDASVSVSAAPVPEPSTMILLGTGLAGLAGLSRRRKLK